MATRIFKILYVARIIFLLDSAGTDQLLPATEERETERSITYAQATPPVPGAAGKSRHIYKSLTIISGNLGQCEKYQSYK